MKDKLQDIIENKINPVLATHNGSCELVDYVDGTVSLKLNGGCVGCPGRRMTIENGIKPLFQQELSEVVDVKLVD
jgi:Fe-S cluster biogenesis protein NfuA